MKPAKGVRKDKSLTRNRALVLQCNCAYVLSQICEINQIKQTIILMNRNLNCILFVYNAPLYVIYMCMNIMLYMYIITTIYISCAAKFTKTATMTAARFSDERKCWVSCSVIQE